MNFSRNKSARYLSFLLILVGIILLFFNVKIYLKIEQSRAIALSIKEPAKGPETKPLDDMIHNIISRMTIEEKIGQMMIVNFYGDSLEPLNNLISNYSLSGIMLKSENVRNKPFDEIKKMNMNILAHSYRIPLIISIDQEGGNVSRLDGILKSCPFPSELYQTKGESGIEESADYTSKKLHDLNINMNYSPVLDVVFTTNSVIYKRSFSANAETNSYLGQIVIQKSRQNQVISVPKHFPGYGNVSTNPHEDVCINNDSILEEISKPFLNLQNPEMIMSSHVIFKKYDDKPATLSKVIIGYLRTNNYSNVIITDDIQMKSITKLYHYQEAALAAIKAGCDMVLSVTQDKNKWQQNIVELHQYLVNSCRGGEISEETLNQSLYRIIKMKLNSMSIERWGILNDEEKHQLSQIISKNNNLSYKK